MKIQVINYDLEQQEGNVIYTKLQSPRSIDEFDYVVIDLTNEYIWRNNHANCQTINCINDFYSIQQMINNRTSATIIFVFPQNVSFKFHIDSSGRYRNNIKMKDILPSLCGNILPNLIPSAPTIDLVYENTSTIIGGETYQAAFFFSSYHKGLTLSYKSSKKTTIELDDKCFATTLDISSSAAVNNYITQLFEPMKIEDAPEWMHDIDFMDDEEQRIKINESETVILGEKQKIVQAKKRLAENDMYKSILYSTGDQLVNVVFMIIEKLLDCDLSGFKDIKQADFIVQKKTYTLIGEIKGVNDNVSNQNISQLENHHQIYMDTLQEKNTEENVHQVLIINPMRKRALDEREPIHENQIKLAKRYNSLIVETKTLLCLFEAFLSGKVTVEKCEELFITKTGLLVDGDFL